MVSGLQAQEPACDHILSGKCVDEHNGEALRYAIIYIQETKQGTLTDTNGFYQIPKVCPGVYTVRCTHIGCDTIEKIVKIQGPVTVNFYPEHHADHLDTVRILGKTPGMTSTQEEEGLTRKEIVETSGQSLGESLKKITGITTLNTGTSISKPVIHGLHSNRILILNNEIRQEGQQWGTEHAPEIDPFLAEQLTVVKGANSVRYGPDAIGGVVKVNPRKLRDKPGLGGELNLVGFANGRVGTVSGRVEGNFAKVPALSWRTQGTYKRGGNVRAPNYFLKNTGVQEYNYSAAVGYTRQQAGIEAFFSAFHTDLGIFSGSHIGNLTDLQRAFEAEQPLDSAGFTYRIGRPSQQVNHRLLKTKAFLRTGILGKVTLTYGAQFNRRQEFDRLQFNRDSLELLNQPQMELALTTHTGNLDWEHYRKKGIKGSVGMMGMFQNNTYEGRFFIPYFRKYGGGIYWIEHYQADSSKLELEAGVRFDYVYQQAALWENDEVTRPEFTYNNFSGTVGATYHFSPLFLLRANAGTAWRPPGINELFSNGLHHGAATVEIGDTSLLREQSYSFSLSAEYQGEFLSVQFSPYANVFRDFIYLVPTLPPTLTIRGAFPTYYYRQVDALLTGGDLTIRYQFLKDFTFTSKVSLLRAFDRTNGEYLVQMPADRFEHSLEYTLPDFAGIHNAYLSLSTLNVLRQTRVPPNSDFVDPPPGYMLFGIQAGWEIPVKGQRITCGVGVSNLFNVSYRDYLNRFRYYTDDLGRNITFRVKIPFNLPKR